MRSRILHCAYAEPHQVVGGAAARAHANTTILEYVKMLPEIMHQSLDFGLFSAYGSIMHQSLDFGPFSAYGSIGALC